MMNRFFIGILCGFLCVVSAEIGKAAAERSDHDVYASHNEQLAAGIFYDCWGNSDRVSDFDAIVQEMIRVPRSDATAFRTELLGNALFLQAGIAQAKQDRAKLESTMTQLAAERQTTRSLQEQLDIERTRHAKTRGQYEGIVHACVMIGGIGVVAKLLTFGGHRLLQSLILVSKQ